MGNDFKLPSPIEVAILELLSGKEMYGLEMVKASDRLKRGTIYVTLNRMEEKGLVKSRVVEESGLTAGRRIYGMTGHGQRAYVAWQRMQMEFSSAIYGGGGAQ
jgi:PadR family transcriptional regulator, regulatory protein PadR